MGWKDLKDHPVPPTANGKGHLPPAPSNLASREGELPGFGVCPNLGLLVKLFTFKRTMNKLVMKLERSGDELELGIWEQS